MNSCSCTTLCLKSNVWNRFLLQIQPLLTSSSWQHSCISKMVIWKKEIGSADDCPVPRQIWILGNTKSGKKLMGKTKKVLTHQQLCCRSSDFAEIWYVGARKVSKPGRIDLSWPDQSSSVGSCMQHYKSLCMWICCATLYNTQIQTAFDLLYYFSQPQKFGILCHTESSAEAKA